MKIKKVNATDYHVFFASFSSDEEDIVQMIHDKMKIFQKKLQLKGFYQVVVFRRFFGLFLQILQVDHSYYKNSFEFRIVFNDDMDFYFLTKDYFIIQDCHFIHFSNGNYYALVDSSFHQILEKVEFGEFVFASDVDFFSQDVVIINK